MGPVILLVSALLTAGYLLPITVNGFLPGKDYDYAHFEKKEPSCLMTIPLMILAVLAVVLGMFPNGFVSFVSEIAQTIMK